MKLMRESNYSEEFNPKCEVCKEQSDGRYCDMFLCHSCRESKGMCPCGDDLIEECKKTSCDEQEDSQVVNCKECDYSMDKYDYQLCYKDKNGDFMCKYCYEEDDEWIEVYDEPKPFPIDTPVQDDIGTTTFQGYTYYNCWGGGPEGGYLTCGEFTVIKINRTWYEPWKVVKRYVGYKIVYREQDEMKGITRGVQLVKL